MNDMPTPGTFARPVRQVAKITHVTLYPPGGPPIEIDGEHVHAAGVDPANAVNFVVIMNPDTGGITKYIGLPMRMDEAPPSGLLAVG